MLNRNVNNFSLGNIGELIAAKKAIELGYEVFFPFGGSSIADMVILKGTEVLRVQVKCYNNDGKSVEIKCGNNINYTQDNIDAIVFVDPNTEECYWIDADRIADMVTFRMRFTRPLNNQTKGINLAENYIWKE